MNLNFNTLDEIKLLNIGFEYFNITGREYITKSRRKNITHFRFCIAFILFENHVKISNIGKLLNRDRTTIYHYLKVINNPNEKEILLKLKDFRNYYNKINMENLAIKSGFLDFTKTVFNCPYCNKTYNDVNDKYLNRCNNNKNYATKIKCNCGKFFFMTYNYKGEAIAIKNLNNIVN